MQSKMTCFGISVETYWINLWLIRFYVSWVCFCPQPKVAAMQISSMCSGFLLLQILNPIWQKIIGAPRKVTCSLYSPCKKYLKTLFMMKNNIHIMGRELFYTYNIVLSFWQFSAHNSYIPAHISLICMFLLHVFWLFVEINEIIIIWAVLIL